MMGEIFTERGFHRKELDWGMRAGAESEKDVSEREARG